MSETFQKHTSPGKERYLQNAAWVEIAPDQIRRNLHAARTYLAPGNRFCAVLKADAYGHGIANVLPVLMEEGVDFIGITSNAEVRAVRSAGYAGRILRLRPAGLSEAMAVEAHGVEEQVGSSGAATELARLGAASKLPRPVHLSLNAGGMGRDGVELACADGRQICRDILGLDGLRIVGLMTHFPCNTPEDLETSRARFDGDVTCIFEDNPGLRREDVLVHAGSSLTLMARATAGYDMVRCGAVLYGVVGPRDAFDTTMRLLSRVVAVGRFPKGDTVGYDRAFTLKRDSRLACVSIGYADGYRRCFGNRGSVVIRGRRVPVLGKISMNTLIADVTDVPEAAVQDEVVLFGPKIPPREIESLSDSILADHFVDWGRSNPRQLRRES